MATKTYDPNKVIVIFGGIPISGFADGTFINIVAAADRFTKKVGADGEVARAKTNDFTNEVTLTLLQTSLSNTYLSTVANLDRLSNAGALPLLITDTNGDTLESWGTAWVKKMPDSGFAKETGERAWAFDTGQSIIDFVGGVAGI